MSFSDTASRYCERIFNGQAALKWRMLGVADRSREIFRRVVPFAMTSAERIAAVCDTVHYVTKAGIPGAYVKCGVSRGGSSMAAELSLIADEDRDRDLVLFDTFEGMSAPTEHDVRANDADRPVLLNRIDRTGRMAIKATS